MGGIGKTALAQQYVRTAKAEYPGGRWYFKLREQGLVTQLVGAAVIFGWQLPDSLPDDRARAKWCYDQWCHHYPGTRLLLLDDVQAYRDVKNLLPQDDVSFRVLMTSRQRFEPPVDRLDLGVLSLDEAMALFSQLVGNEERVKQQQSEVEGLCEWVGRLPLGVELIARYLALHPNLSFDRLQARLEGKHLDAKALRQASEEMAYDQLADYEKPIEAAFELSWQDLEPEARTLMGLLAVFAAAPIPQGLIAGALPGLDEEDLEDALDTVLVRRNLLQSDEDGSYQLHQLIREFMVLKLNTELRAETSALQKDVADSLVNFAKQIQPIVTVSAQQRVSEAIPHMALVAQTFSPVIEDSTDTLWPFAGLGRFYESQSLWSEAEHWWQACLDMTEERFGSDHPDTASSLNNLALLYRSIGRYTDAEPLYTRSLNIREKQLGPEHPDTASSLNNLALLYDSMGRYTDAEPLYARSLDIREKQLGPEHPDTASSLNNLAGLYRSMGRYTDAEPLYARSLDITEKQLGPEHPDTASSLNNLAVLYRSIGRYTDAEPLYTRSLDIREKQLGPEHPSTASSLNNLAVLYRSMGRYTDAEPLYTRSLDITEKQLGPEHPSTASSLNNLAVLYRSMGRYTDAEPLYARSLDIREKQLGPEHPSTAISLNNLAYLHTSLGNYRQAEPMYLRSLEIKQKVLPPEHPSMKRGIDNFYQFVQQVVEANQAEQLSEHPFTLAILESLQSQ